MARLAARLPVLYRPNARNLQDDARAGRLGITKPKARKHWLEPCARRNATEANRPAVRLSGARDVRRMSPHPISPIAAIPARTKNIFASKGATFLTTRKNKLIH